MARRCVIGLIVFVSCLSAVLTEKTWPHHVATKDFMKHQTDILEFFYHVEEKHLFEKHVTIANTWDIENNIDHYKNATSVHHFMEMWKHGMLPRGHPFAVLNEAHQYQAMHLFHLFWSAKDWETFYKTVCWARVHVNEEMFVYALSVAVIHREDCHGIVLPPLYEIFPHYFFNSEVLTIAQKLNINKDWKETTEHWPHVHEWEHNLVIDYNYTSWHSHMNDEHKLTYFTEDIGVNCFYWYMHVDYPSWLGSDTCPLVKDRRGELWYHQHQQLLARYYLERLSNGLGEIPMFSWNFPIEHGYDSDLMYTNGVEMPVRPNHFDLNHPEYLKHLIWVEEWEHRIREAIDHGYLVTETGEHVTLRTPESIDVLARIIESNVDSPNKRYYRDFITVAKWLLGNSMKPHDWHHYNPSVIENYQTAMRDPVFYQLWKRILWLFWQWQDHLAPYKPEHLVSEGVKIEHVEVDKLMTYFEHYHVNITNALKMNTHEVHHVDDEVSVLVRQTRMNHKPFNVNIKIVSDVEKTVVVKVFLGPKYDSNGHEIPLHENRVNFCELDHFVHQLKHGENTIVRSSDEFTWHIKDWSSGHHLYEEVMDATHDNGKFHIDMSEAHNGWPQRLLLPKGTRAGMPFVFMVYVHDYKAPKIPYGAGFDPIISSGLGTGARYETDEPFGFPLERPIYDWATKHVPNMHFKDVVVYHKITPELHMPHVQW